MAIGSVPQVAGVGAPANLGAGKKSFSKVLAGLGPLKPAPIAPSPQAQPCPELRVGPTPGTQSPRAALALDRVNLAQQRLDQVLKVAQSGKTFTPAELIALQATVFRASQELDLAGKVIEKATAGVKQVLQTQV